MIQEPLGHEDVSPTMVYAHVLLEQRLTASANSVILRPHQRNKGDSICPR
jgi:site-specific recombinase XerD